jgi:hypothetical protein
LRTRRQDQAHFRVRLNFFQQRHLPAKLRADRPSKQPALNFFHGLPIALYELANALGAVTLIGPDRNPIRHGHKQARTTKQ